MGTAIIAPFLLVSSRARICLPRVESLVQKHSDLGRITLLEVIVSIMRG